MIRILLVAVIVSLFSCRSEREGEKTSINAPQREDIEEVNRYLIRKDRERIESYISRKNLDMKETETGLWYSVIKPGTGDTIKDNDIVLLYTDCYLLDGTSVYKSGERGPVGVTIGRSTVESGLDQGLRMLRGGGEGIFILPSHLGHGLLGDGEKIPARAILVFNVRVAGLNGKEF